ncbi:MAG: hypothetical protein GX161_13945 [Firmicutes bacterium]|jgi:hypothetical protein|nr:hypothetical protein [Bacillota bacterium]
MTLVTDAVKRTKDDLAEKFFQLLDMDRTDERFLALYEEVHRAIDRELDSSDNAG